MCVLLSVASSQLLHYLASKFFSFILKQFFWFLSLIRTKTLYRENISSINSPNAITQSLSAHNVPLAKSCIAVKMRCLSKLSLRPCIHARGQGPVQIGSPRETHAVHVMDYLDFWRWLQPDHPPLIITNLERQTHATIIIVQGLFLSPLWKASISL